MNRKKIKFSLQIIVLLLIPLMYCNKSNEKKTEKIKIVKQRIEPLINSFNKVNYKNIIGTWSLKYKNGFGFSFKFNKKNRAFIVIYLKQYALVFRCIYLIEDNNLLKFNIYEMKNEKNLSRLHWQKGFSKAKSSYFIFNGKINSDSKYLIMNPVKVVIAGANSKGYFESNLRLKKQ